MRILYVAMRYDYGKPEQGYSFEHHNFYDALLHMGHDILYFDFVALMQEHNRDWMNRRLLEVAKAEKPELMFTVLHRDELKQDGVREISESTDTVTVNWFCDDHWRFADFSSRWAPCFNWAVTTAQSALPRYAEIGFENVIKSQWACNHFLYCSLDLPFKYDVTFVGQPHGTRRRVIQALRDAGVSVNVWGQGWETGRLSQEEMIRVFNQSRVNLNLSNASMPAGACEHPRSGAIRGRLSHFLERVPLGGQLKAAGKRALALVQTVTQREEISQQYDEQIKGRNFEVPGSGGFILTGRAENLGDYYELGKEVVCFDDVDDLIEKARYYLRHEDERLAIAEAGHQRTLREHTYAHRFTEIFERLRLPHAGCEEILAGEVPQGRTEEVH